jgi:hypothetical protein
MVKQEMPHQAKIVAANRQLCQVAAGKILCSAYKGKLVRIFPTQVLLQNAV